MDTTSNAEPVVLSMPIVLNVNIILINPSVKPTIRLYLHQPHGQVISRLTSLVQHVPINTLLTPQVHVKHVLLVIA